MDLELLGDGSWLLAAPPWQLAGKHWVRLVLQPPLACLRQIQRLRCTALLLCCSPPRPLRLRQGVYQVSLPLAVLCLCFA